MLASCSNDKEVVVSVNDNAVQQIVLQVASNGDGLTTRAGRELLSNEAAQDIDNVDLYIVSTGETPEIVYTYNNDNWQNAATYTNGKMASINLKGNDKLAKGTYKVYALGYSDDTDYIIPKFGNKNEDGNITEGETDIATIENYVLNYKEDKNVAEEIFAGSLDLTVGEDRNFSEAIILHRQVAGTYFYVYNLPMIKDLNTECKIQLVASDYNDQLVLGNFATADHGNGNNSDTDVMYVVNGKKSVNPVGSNVVCEAKIGDWYSAIEEAKDKDGNSIVDKANWKGSKEANRKGGYVKGSIFASNFVMPFKNANKQTLTLQIVDKSGNPLRTWNVNLPKAPAAPIYFDAEISAFTQSSETEDVHNYSIVRNHLYCVGTKSKINPSTNPENPDPDDPDPDDPDPDDPDPEIPQDLTVGQNLTLKVNHNWEVIYHMVLD